MGMVSVGSVHLSPLAVGNQNTICTARAHLSSSPRFSSPISAVLQPPTSIPSETDSLPKDSPSAAAAPPSRPFRTQSEKRMSKDQPKWLPPTTPPPDDLNSIPLPTLPNGNLASSSSTTLRPQTHPQAQQATKQNNLNLKPSSTSTATAVSPALPTSASYAETNNTNTSTTLHTTVNGGAGYLPSERPSGIPRCIVRVDRDHDAGDEATRFEAEMFPIEFLGRVTRPEFTATVHGINECMRVAEESILNCLDTLLDCLTAYTAKHCCGTHYQRSLRKMETFIHHENERVYHPARIHLRDPQKVGMIYLEFEVF